MNQNFYFACLLEQHDMCLQRRRNTLEKQHQQAENFLEKMREKKLRDLDRWKLKHARMRERSLQVRFGKFMPGENERVINFHFTFSISL